MWPHDTRSHTLCSIWYLVVIFASDVSKNALSFLGENGLAALVFVYSFSMESTVKILKFGTPQTIAIIVLKLVKFDVTLH